MKVRQERWCTERGWSGEGELGGEAQLVLVFGARERLADGRLLAELAARHPRAHRIGCSTAGEIAGTRVHDDTLVATAVRFERTRLALERVVVEDPARSEACGERLAESLAAQDLRHVFVLSDGLCVNGSALAAGLRSRLGAVAVTGGLAGDGERFERTLVLCDESARPGEVLALGLYGEALQVGYGSLGGWDPFGPLRRVTRSRGNVLEELDGQPALELYKRYLGEHAAGLPATGLFFPLSLRVPGSECELVRTILAIDESRGSMTFAGDVPQGALARLMRANFDRLVDGAAGAARVARAPGEPEPELAILISCVGRKLLLAQRIEEEVEAVREVLGPGPALCGFYSYGELSPSVRVAPCDLHNQTMTITTLAER